MKDDMRRGRSQVIWRYLSGATFRYNDSGGWCQTDSVTLQNVQPITGALAEAVHHSLKKWNALGDTGFPDPLIQPSRYVTGEPLAVMYDIWPLVFTCRLCGRVHFYRDIENLKQYNERLRCRTCNGDDQLRQVPYAYVCECGRLDTVYIPKHDINHIIKLVNRDTFQDSFWYCETCRKPLRQNARSGLGIRTCECSKNKRKRGILLDDSRVYYAQTVDMVDIEPASLDPWRENPRFGDLLLSAVLKTSAYKPSDLLDLANRKPKKEGLSPELEQALKEMIDDGIPEDTARNVIERAAKKTSTDPWAAYDASLKGLRDLAGNFILQDTRQTVEYVFVRDEPSSTAISLDDLINQAEALNDKATSDRYKHEKALALQLGLVDLQIVQSLPILLAGIGYSRYFSSPTDATEDDGASHNARPATLRPFEYQDHKIAVYTARNTTEALLYELDPWRVAAFLSLNTGLETTNEALRSEQHLRAWLLGNMGRLIQQGESHFVLREYEIEHGQTVDETSALMFGLLHTMSHVLKATAHRYVGIDNDSLAEYLFPAHASGLLYVSSHVEFTLGGIDSVFRSNMTQWLASARDYASKCSFDPICSRTGGACLACLYPKFGCGYFNRTLSRSFLFGGDIQGRAKPLIGYWSREVTEKTNELAEQACHDVVTDAK